MTLQRLPTIQLLDLTVEAGYEGRSWLELQRRFIERSLSDLTNSIRSGTIFGRCSRAGFGLQRRPELQQHPHPEEIAAEAVEDCLHRFRNRVLPAGEWNSAKGVSLEDFFVSCSLPDVANAWRRHLLLLPEHEMSLDALLESDSPRLRALTTDQGSEPAEIVVLREVIAQALVPLKPEDRRSFTLLAAGWSLAEIAHDLGITRSALDARLSRARKLMRVRRSL